MVILSASDVAGLLTLPDKRTFFLHFGKESRMWRMMILCCLYSWSGKYINILWYRDVRLYNIFIVWVFCSPFPVLFSKSYRHKSWFTFHFLSFQSILCVHLCFICSSVYLSLSSSLMLCQFACFVPTSPAVLVCSLNQSTHVFSCICCLCPLVILVWVLLTAYKLELHI